LTRLKICTGYRWTGGDIDYLPVQCRQSRRASDRFTKRWKAGTDTSFGARSWAALPAEAVRYVRYIEELIGAPVTLLSTSPERDDTILVRDPFED
jgi:adenylosuccinate synthase